MVWGFWRIGDTFGLRQARQQLAARPAKELGDRAMGRQDQESRAGSSGERSAAIGRGRRPRSRFGGDPRPRYSYRTQFLKLRRGMDAAERAVTMVASVETAQPAVGGRTRSKLDSEQVKGLRIVQAMLVIAVLGLASMLVLYFLGPVPDQVASGGATAGAAVVGPSPTPSPTPVLAYQGPFAPGQNVRIVNTEACLNARTYPSVSAPVWSCLPDGSDLRIVLGPIYSDTMWWWAAAQEGWVAEPYLAPAEEGGQ